MSSKISIIFLFIFMSLGVKASDNTQLDDNTLEFIHKFIYLREQGIIMRESVASTEHPRLDAHEREIFFDILFPLVMREGAAVFWLKSPVQIESNSAVDKHLIARGLCDVYQDFDDWANEDRLKFQMQKCAERGTQNYLGAKAGILESIENYKNSLLLFTGIFKNDLPMASELEVEAFREQHPQLTEDQAFRLLNGQALDYVFFVRKYLPGHLTKLLERIEHLPGTYFELAREINRFEPNLPVAIEPAPVVEANPTKFEAFKEKVKERFSPPTLRKKKDRPSRDGSPLSQEKKIAKPTPPLSESLEMLIPRIKKNGPFDEMDRRMTDFAIDKLLEELVPSKDHGVQDQTSTDVPLDDQTDDFITQFAESAVDSEEEGSTQVVTFDVKTESDEQESADIIKLEVKNHSSKMDRLRSVFHRNRAGSLNHQLHDIENPKSIKRALTAPEFRPKPSKASPPLERLRKIARKSEQ